MQNRYLNRALTSSTEEERKERSRLLRQTYEAIKVLPTEKVREYRDKSQNDAGIKFR